ncbi:polyprenyl synthetase family protein [Microbacterium sp. gxy059]|uniref:polyprenyl synthetase family protein n=1 Tax=Microbacterium sp. gxy059 TaxID=2957199 RepID=UPI003D95BF09
MTPSPASVKATSQRLASFLAERAEEIRLDPVFAGLPDADPVASVLVDAAASALDGGKRLRARFACGAWRAVTGAETLAPEAVDLGAALEVFQAAALVHDDIVDNSDTRRGRPSAHRALEARHRASGWDGDAEAFGRSAAVLLGDLLLGWSDDLFESAAAAAGGDRRARAEYARMRRDVILGQFLDVAEEATWVTIPDAAHADRALRIATLKSARYSVQQPLVIGAALGGADDDALRALREVGTPTGLAFQLRDDVLGVFGDPSVTGKPSGDDLREGKRTLLVALARESMSPVGRARFDGALGRRDLSDGDIAALQDDIRETGSLDRVEERIAGFVADAERQLDDGRLAPGVRDELLPLIEAATRRAA